MKLCWGARPAEINNAAENVKDFLSAIFDLGPSFQNWFLPAKSVGKLKRMEEIDIRNVDRIKLILEKSIQYASDGDKPLDELGYRIRLLNSDVEKNINSNITIGIGRNSNFLDPDGQNIVVFETSSNSFIVDESAMKSLFQAANNIWRAKSGHFIRKNNDKTCFLCYI